MFQGLLFSLISGITYGLLGIFVKFGYMFDMSAFDMLQQRFIYGALAIFIYIQLKDRSLLKTSRSTIIKAAILGLIIYPAQSWLFMQSFKLIPASTAVLTFYLYPVTVTILTAIFFKTPITRLTILSLFIVLGGCSLVFFDAFANKVDMIGIYYALAAMFVFSINLTFCQKVLSGQKPLTISFYVMLFAGLFFCAVNSPENIIADNMNQFWIGLGLGLIPTALSISLLYFAIELVGSSYASIFSTVEPISTIVAGSILLGEQIFALQIIGMFFIIIGIIVPNIPEIRQRRLLLKNNTG
ncbi:MAG: DMT family transporter [Desulfovibrio sp.]